MSGCLRSLLTAALVLYGVLFTVFAQAQNSDASASRTLRGYVQEAGSAERLIGATVFDRDRGLGTATNEFGFFTYTYTGDTARLQVRYVGYAPLDTVLVGPQPELSLSLSEGGTLRTVEVRATEQAERIDERVQMSQVDVPVAQIKRAPVLLGETDVLKTVQLLPGVSGGTEGTAGLYVRGGSPDQNLILLDGVPVYNVSHVLGLFSVFNADAVKSVTLTKGGFPARYGGRLSSVLEVNMRDGAADQWNYEGAVGMLLSRLTVDGPLGEDTRLLVSGRRSYIDLITGPITRAVSASRDDLDLRQRLNFFDLNLKLRHRLSDRDALYLSAYRGGDIFGSRVRTDRRPPDYEEFEGSTRWGNDIVALRYNREIGRRAFSNLTATYSNYRIRFLNAYERSEDDALTRAVADYRSGIEDLGLRYDLSYRPSPRHHLRTGAGLTHHTYRPGATQYQLVDPELDPQDTTIGRRSQRGLEAYVYVEDEWRLSPELSLNVGLHASGFRSDGTAYGSLQPRLAARYRTPGGWAVKASFASMAQYVNLLSSEALSLPTDVWVPTTPRVRPQRSWQVAAGVAKVLDERYEFSAEAFYKRMDGVVSYLPGASFSGFRPEDDWEDLVTQGRGEVYGLELLAQRKVGRTTGWIGYTLSWNNRTFEEINAGQPFPFRYDRRHDFSSLVSHRFNDRVTLSGSWVYATGNAYTLPRYNVNTDFARGGQLDGGQLGGRAYYQYNTVGQTVAKNDYRLSATHRLDLSVALTKPKRFFKREGTRTWVWGVYNAYWHKNPVYVQPATRYDEATDTESVEYVEYSLLPIIPSISYQFEF